MQDKFSLTLECVIVRYYRLAKYRRAFKLTMWRFLGVYLVYVVFTGMLVFFLFIPSEAVDDFPKPVQTEERVVSIDSVYEAWAVRVDLIESAEKTVDIAYFAMQGGKRVQYFYGAVLSAADRGVHIRILMDGLMHGMMRDSQVVQVFHEHPNIELQFYEPISLVKPWTIQNRLHEKMLIVDGKNALTGGSLQITCQGKIRRNSILVK